MRSSFRMARSCYSRIFVQANARQYCSFQPNRRQRMRRSLKRKRKHNHLLQTGSAAGRRRTVERRQRNDQIDGVYYRHVPWRPNHKRRSLPPERSWGSSFTSPLSSIGRRENWRTSQDVITTAAPFGMHVVDLDTADLAGEDEIVFTLYWNEERRWRGQDFRISIV
jgi:hypothetical protein